MNIMKCRTCNTTFQDNGSLEIHYQYTHNNNNNNNPDNGCCKKKVVESSCSSICSSAANRESLPDVPDVAATATATISSIETNNNRFFKFDSRRELSPTSRSCSTSTMTAISPGLGTSTTTAVHSSSPVAGDSLQHVNNNHNNNINSNSNNGNFNRDLSPYNALNHHNHHSYDTTGGGYTPLSSGIHEFNRNVPTSNTHHHHHHSFNGGMANNQFEDQTQRFHPYYKPGFRDPRSQFHIGHSSSPLSQMIVSKCDKCDFACGSQDVLLQHMHVVHGGVSFMHQQYPGLNHHPAGSRFSHRPGEPQAEILDLDSHKVHVYQPPNSGVQNNHNNGNNHNDNNHVGHRENRLPQDGDYQKSAFESWVNETTDDKKYYSSPPANHLPHRHIHHHHLQQSDGCVDGGVLVNSNHADVASSRDASLPSPDFGSVSTTTDNIENFHATTNAVNNDANYDQHPPNVVGTGAVAALPSNQISSSNGSGIQTSSKKSGGKAGNNASWKSNEARRPKTYNCSACNKWFTSSGHLKRHYNTTLHKNAVKQSGGPDPATLPMSAHHHPQKDSNGDNSTPPIIGGQQHSSSSFKSSPPTPTESTSSSEAPSTSSPAMKNERSSTIYSGNNNIVNRSISQMSPPNYSFLHSSSNLIGPPDISSGLFHPHPTFPTSATMMSIHDLDSSTTPPDLMKSPSPISTGQQPPATSVLNPTNYHHIIPFTNPMSSQAPSSLQLFQQHPQSTFYPNFQSPHVSTIRPVTTINHSGNSHYDDISVRADSRDNITALPNFSNVRSNNGNLWNCSQYFGLDHLLTTTTSDSTSNSNNSNSALHHNNNGNVGGHVKYSQFDDNDENTPPLSRDELDDNANDDYSSEDLFAGDGTAVSPYEDNSSPPTIVYTSEDLFARSTKIKRQFDSAASNIFDPVPDTKTDAIISPKPEEDSFYDDDDNTTVSSSTSAGPTQDSNQHILSPIAEMSVVGGSSITSSKCNPVANKRKTVVQSTHIGGSAVSAARRFLCHKCDKSFNKACYLTQHNKSFHSGYKPYKCTRCGKRFNEPEQYKHHTAKHAGDKPHKCEICPKQFNHKTDLRRHVCLHTNNRPHTCDVCQKGFIRKDHMLKHRETHANAGRKQIFRQVKIEKMKRELNLTAVIR